MTIENSRISAGQFMFSIACFLHSSSLLTSFFVIITRNESWMPFVASIIICIPLIVSYVLLSKSYPGMNLIQINEAVFGRVAGKIVSALYVWFFFTLTSLNIRDLGTYVNKTTMVKTPISIIIILFLLLCVWSAYYGLEVVTRYSIVFLIISCVILFISIIAVYDLIELDNFLPMFDMPLNNYVQLSHIASTIPFGETVIFLMVTPYVDNAPKNLMRYFLGGFLLGSILILIVILRDISVLGNTIQYFSLPSFEVFRLGTLFQTISHMEIMFSILLIVLLYFKISVLFYVTMLAIAQLLNIRSYRPILLPCAALVVVYAFTAFKDVITHTKTAQETTPFFWTLFEILLPVLTLIVSFVKKKAKNKNNRKAVSK